MTSQGAIPWPHRSDTERADATTRPTSRGAYVGSRAAGAVQCQSTTLAVRSRSGGTGQGVGRRARKMLRSPERSTVIVAVLSVSVSAATRSTWSKSFAWRGLTRAGRCVMSSGRRERRCEAALSVPPAAPSWVTSPTPTPARTGNAPSTVMSQWLAPMRAILLEPRLTTASRSPESLFHYTPPACS